MYYQKQCSRSQARKRFLFIVFGVVLLYEEGAVHPRVKHNEHHFSSGIVVSASQFETALACSSPWYASQCFTGDCPFRLLLSG